MKTKIIGILLLSLLVGKGCSFQNTYMSIEKQNEYWKNNSSSHIVKSQKAQIKNLHPNFTNKTIYIEPIIFREKDLIGIFGFSQYSTHFDGVQFFSFENNEVKILRRVNLDSLQASIQFF